MTARRDAGAVSARPTPSVAALTLAGLDPSGGAGIAADLRAFHAAGVWGCAVVTVITVQSTAGLLGVTPIAPALVLSQAREVLAHQRIRAMKSGALGSADNVRALGRLARAHPDVPLVVDPVLMATLSRGARLLDEAALDAMRRLLPRAALVTPNSLEAAALLGSEVRDRRDQRDAAEALVARGARAALVKGGHVSGEDATDVLATRGRTIAIRAARLPGPPTHGGGCILASLIAGRLARDGGDLDEAIPRAVRWAKRRLSDAWARAADVGEGLLVLDPRA